MRMMSLAVYRVTGVYIGGNGRENVVGLEVLDLESGVADGQPVREMLVPEDMVRLARVG